MGEEEEKLKIKTKREGFKKKKNNIEEKKLVEVESMELQGDNEANQDAAYAIYLGDEHCFNGMKKWITEYHQRRPDVEILQERIDDFITSHEAHQEQERKEREARAAEGGWTVVAHHKGREKTTNSESGIAVGAAHAIVIDRIAKKTYNVVGLNFYRFQKREA